MTWATVADVLAVTGETVAEKDVLQASAIVDTYAGTSEEMPEDSITPRDRKILKKATIWQAAWMSGKPGIIFHRESARSTSADSVSVARAANSDVILAPLAAREIKNLSWLGTRTEVQRPAGRRLPNPLDFLNERSDPDTQWDPL